MWTFLGAPRAAPELGSVWRGIRPVRLRLQLAALGALIATLWAAYTLALGPRIGWPPAALLGVLGSLFLLLLVSGAVQLVRGMRLRALLGRAPDRALREDGPVAWSGQVAPLREASRAPLSGKPSLAWEYEFEEKLTGGSADPRRWFGMGQVPFVIGAPHGDVEVRCGVLPDALRWKTPRGADWGSAARALTERSDAADASGIGSGLAMLARLEELLGDEDGDARLEWRTGDAGGVGDVQGLRERRLEPGQQVTAVGWYSASRRAFVPHAKGLQLFLDDAEAVRKGALASAWGTLAFALPTNVLIQGLVLLAWFRAP